MLKWILLMVIVKFLVEIVFTNMKMKVLFLIGAIIDFVVCMKVISFFITSMLGLIIAGIILGIISVFNFIFCWNIMQRSK